MSIARTWARGHSWAQVLIKPVLPADQAVAELKKANVNKQDKKGTCGFFLACMNGETYYRVVQINRD